MIDLPTFRDCNGVGRDVLVLRIVALCEELHEARVESAWDSEVLARAMRDNAEANRNLAIVHAECNRLLKENRKLRGIDE